MLWLGNCVLKYNKDYQRIFAEFNLVFPSFKKIACLANGTLCEYSTFTSNTCESYYGYLTLMTEETGIDSRLSITPIALTYGPRKSLHDPFLVGTD
jgi:hypothetical protein